MQTTGTLCVHVTAVPDSTELQGVETFSDPNGTVLWTSEPFAILAGNAYCLGPICVNCEMQAAFSSGPDTGATPKRAETKPMHPPARPAPATPARPPVK